jgi:hypothetical protein
VDGIKLQSVRAKPRQLDPLITFSEMILVRKLVHTYHSYLRFFNTGFIIFLKEVLPGDLPVYSVMTSNGTELGPKTCTLVVHWMRLPQYGRLTAAFLSFSLVHSLL